MAISDRTRKILWGRSGNLCAFCRRLLVEDATSLSDESVVGDESHIIGEKPTAARGESGIGCTDLDDYENLILLCKVHHKLVDDQFETYSIDRLREMKSAHERWVRETLGKSRGRKAHFALLHRITTGKQISNLISGAMAYVLDHDEPESEDEVELLGSMLDDIRDWGDCWSELEVSDKVKAQYSLTMRINELEVAGFLLFGLVEHRKLRSEQKVIDWQVTIFTIVRPSNKGITPEGLLASLIVE